MPLLIILSKSRSRLSKGNGQQVMEHSSFPLEFQLPEIKDKLPKNVVN